jgi:hypothetical protein
MAETMMCDFLIRAANERELKFRKWATDGSPVAESRDGSALPAARLHQGQQL